MNRFSANAANVAKSLLEGNRAHLLTQARTELMKQEHKVESLNNFISELQQQAYAQRLDLESAHHGYVESRREQVRPQEELISHERKSSSRYSDPKYTRNGTKNWELVNSLYRSWEKVMKQYRDSFHKYTNYKKWWIIWVTLENSTK